MGEGRAGHEPWMPGMRPGSVLVDPSGHLDESAQSGARRDAEHLRGTRGIQVEEQPQCDDLPLPFG
jgi:hypothetical protein